MRVCRYNGDVRGVLCTYSNVTIPRAGHVVSSVPYVHFYATLNVSARLRACGAMYEVCRLLTVTAECGPRAGARVPTAARRGTHWRRQQGQSSCTTPVVPVWACARLKAWCVVVHHRSDRTTSDSSWQELSTRQLPAKTWRASTRTAHRSAYGMSNTTSV